MRRGAPVVLALLLTCGSTSVSAKGFELTPFLGFSIDAESYGDALPSYGLVFGMPKTESAAFEVILTRQIADARVGDPFAGPTTEAEVQIDRLHFGGVYTNGDGRKKLRGFVTFTLGVTHMTPPTGFSDGWDPSFAIGGGAKIRAGEKTRIRLQAKWVSINAGSGTLACVSGTCVISNDNLVGGVELSTGVTIVF
jgi:hypothetical protein